MYQKQSYLNVFNIGDSENSVFMNFCWFLIEAEVDDYIDVLFRTIDHSTDQVWNRAILNSGVKIPVHIIFWSVVESDVFGQSQIRYNVLVLG